MNPRIFELKLDVIPTSVYIIVANLISPGQVTTLDRIKPLYNGPPEALPGALAELVRRGVLKEWPEGYELVSDEEWT
ncbi:MAG: hypothetical protein HQK59_17475 [Deltaproteobacteria bacterium]|nr:hypothetical protein [Deltaproteobacteria bacterium]